MSNTDEMFNEIMDKLKENAVRVEEVDGKIKLDKQNKADVEWYEEEQIMYRFLLFSYAEYYPCGGLDDLILQFNTIEELKEVDTSDISDYIEVYDFKAGKEIFEDRSPYRREYKVDKLVAKMKKYLK